MKLFRRLLILCFLCACLFVLSTPLHVRVLAATCDECDSNFGACLSPCYFQHEDCIANMSNTGNSQAFCDQQYSNCQDGCFTTYTHCLDLCTFRDPNTGQDTGSRNICGHSRSSCELACNDAEHQCAQSGGTDCGTTYQDCMVQCCE